MELFLWHYLDQIFTENQWSLFFGDQGIDFTIFALTNYLPPSTAIANCTSSLLQLISELPYYKKLTPSINFPLIKAVNKLTYVEINAVS